MTALYTGHPPVRPFVPRPEEDGFYELVSRVLAERPGLLRPVHHGADARFVIFEIAPTDDGRDDAHEP